jgi:peptide/nickel transport system substrate-binding protein
MRHTVHQPMVRGAAALMVATVVAAACGGSSTSSGTNPAPSTTVPTTAGPPSADTKVETPLSSPDSAAATTVPTTEVAEAEPVIGGKLVAALQAETSSPWTPANMQCANSCVVAMNAVYDRLFGVDQDRNLVGVLAESIDTDAAGTTHTMKLRTGISFTDGTPFDAAAVVDNINRYRSSFLVGKALTGITDVKALDSSTVGITTSLPLQGLGYAFANPQPGYMASPTWLAAADADATLQSKPVGTGAFTMTSYSPGVGMTLKKNPNYWRTDPQGRQLPYLDEVEFRVIVDDISRRKALQGGDIDVLNTQSGETILELQDAEGIVFVENYEYTDTNYVLFKLTPDSPLTNKDLRCGLAAAINQEAAAEALAGGFPLANANGIFSPGQDGYLADNGFSGYDPELAKELIAKWKAETGGGKVILTTVPDQQALATAEFYQADWADAGIDVEVQQIEEGVLITNALTGAPDFNMFTWRNHSGFLLDNLYVWWHSSTAQDPPELALNFGRLKDPEIDRLLDENRATADQSKRQAIGEAINRRFASECYVIPQYWTPWAVAYSDKVGGYDSKINPDGTTPIHLAGYFNVAGMWKGE